MNILFKRDDFKTINENIQENSNGPNFNEANKSAKNIVDILEDNDVIGEIRYIDDRQNSEKKETRRKLKLHELIETKKSILFSQMTTDIFNAASAKPLVKLTSRNSREDLLRNKIKYLLRRKSKKDIITPFDENKNKSQVNLRSILPDIKNPKYNYLSLSTKEKIKVLNNLIKSGNIIENSNSNLYKENYYMLHENNNPYNINIKHKEELKKKKKNYQQKQIDMMFKTFNTKNFDQIDLIKSKKGGKSKINKGKLSKGKDKQAEIIQEEIVENEEVNQDSENQQLKMIDELEAGGKIEDIDLTTDDWVNVNPLEITKRYEMLRRYATAKINSLKNEYNKLNISDKEKIDKLKKQYYEHRVLWETERLVLLNVKEMEFSWDRERSQFLDKADIAYKLQEQAEETATKAIKQLEEFITEDAKLDRENVENTITIMRERSRTYTNLSVNKETSNDANERRTEKVQVLVDNLTIKFSTKSAFEKIIEYINFETSNKYTVIFNQFSNNNSRPNTRGTNLSVASKPGSPAVRKLSGTKAHNMSLFNKKRNKIITESENNNKSARSSKTAHYTNYLDDNYEDYEDFDFNSNLMDSIKCSDEKNEFIISETSNKEEEIIAGLRDTLKNRACLRSKHLAKLEETKLILNQIKSHEIVNDDFDFPSNDYINEQNTTSEKLKHAEAILNRIASSKINDAKKSIDILSHPIVIEFLKLYDIIWNFKNLIEKIIPKNYNSNMNETLYRLNKLNIIRFNKTEKVTPQIVKMTLTADMILSEIKLLFDQTVYELVLCKYDILDKENQLLNLSQETDYIELKDKLQNLEIQNQIDSEFYKNEINNHLFEIKRLSKVVIELRKDLEDEKRKKLILRENIPSYIMNNTPLFLRSQTSISSYRDNDLLEKKHIFPLINTKKSGYNKNNDDLRFLLEAGVIRNFMFSKLDIERNKKRLENANERGQLSKGLMQSAIKIMDDYTKVISKKFIELVKSYHNYKIIKSALIESKDFLGEESDFSMDKIKEITEKKGEISKTKMKILSQKRIDLAIELNDTLEKIEDESGIFLIKPHFSYQGENFSDRLIKLNRLRMNKSFDTSFINKKTISNYCLIENSSNKYLNQSSKNIINENQQKNNDFEYNQKNWDALNTTPEKSKLSKASSACSLNLLINTPRILELDINRMMISQNKISSKSNNLNLNNLRSYLAISRPNGTNLDLNSSTDSVLLENKKSISSMILPPIPLKLDKSIKGLNEKNFNSTNQFPDEASSLKSGSATNGLERAYTNLI